MYKDGTTRMGVLRAWERGWMTQCRVWERGWTTQCRAWERGQTTSVQGVGAGLDDSVQGVRASWTTRCGARDDMSEDKGTGCQDGSTYVLANPRLLETPNDGTVVHPTGAAHSAPGTPPGPNLPHSQNPIGESQCGMKRVASDAGGSTSSSRSGGSIKSNHESIRAKDVLTKRR